MENKINLDSYLGCIIGGAIGDALGYPIEFEDIKTDGLIRDYKCENKHSGRFSDDTQMTLFTIEGLVNSNLSQDPNECITNVYNSYLNWVHTQFNSYKGKRPDISDLLDTEAMYRWQAPGGTCISALKSGICGTIENPINNSKGCGGIMRVAPVGLVYYYNPELAFKIGADLAAITHGHPTGYLSAGVFSSIIAYLVQGYSLQNAIMCSIDILRDYDNFEETLKIIGQAHMLFKLEQPSIKTIEKIGEGWIAEEALGISLYCALCHENNFEEGVILAINHSGDSDSTGAITGNILGLINGINNIPQRWLDGLNSKEIVEKMTLDLYGR